MLFFLIQLGQADHHQHGENRPSLSCLAGGELGGVEGIFAVGIKANSAHFDGTRDLH